MDWIILNILLNKRLDRVVVGLNIVILVFEFFARKFGGPRLWYISFVLLVTFVVIGLIILILYYSFRRLYLSNQSILESIPQLREANDYEGILKIVERIKFFTPQLIQKIYWRGIANSEVGESEKALQDFNWIEKEYKDSAGFYYNKARVLIEMGENEKAIEYLTRSIELSKTSQNLDQRGVAYLNVNQLDNAGNDLEESIKLNLNPINTCNYGVYLAEKGEYKQAIEYYTKSIELDENKSHVYCNRGIVFKELKNWDLAIKDFNKAEELGHRNDYLNLWRGLCKCENGDKANGLIELEKALEGKNKNAERLIEKYSAP